MNINQLKYFIAVAQYRSFTKAANQYFISQTAITQQIQALEEQMNVQLFDRTKRPVGLTPAGSVFLVEAKAILERMNMALEKVREASTGLVGTVRIGYTKGYERSDLSKVLRRFHLKYPNILLSCFRCDTDALAVGLLNRDYDIIFTWDSTNITQDPEVEHQLYEMAPLVVAMYSSHPFAQRTSLDRRDLRSETILFMTPSSDGESYGDGHFMDLYHQAGYYPNILFRSNDIESILMMVAAEEGISILPSYVTNKLTNADNLVFVPLVGEAEYEQVICVWRKEDDNIALKYFLKNMQ